jgi:hypothetical protein
MAAPYRAIVVLALTALASSPPTAAAETAVTLGGVEAVVWTPDTPVAKAPVVVFSHGIALCATQSRYLTEAAARAGYLVVAPQHADRNCVAAGEEPGDSEGFAGKPALLWTDGDYRDRRDDVRNVLAAMKTDERYRDADFTRIGLSATRSAATRCSGSPARGRRGRSTTCAPSSRCRRTCARTRARAASRSSRRRCCTRAARATSSRRPARRVPALARAEAYVEFAARRTTRGPTTAPATPRLRARWPAWAIAFLDRHVKGRTDVAFPDPKSPGIAKALRAPRASAHCISGL